MHNKFDSDNWKYFLSLNENNLNKFIFGAFFKFNKKSYESFFSIMHSAARVNCSNSGNDNSGSGNQHYPFQKKPRDERSVCVSEWVMFMIFIFVCFLLIFQSQFSVAIFCSVSTEMRGKGFYNVSTVSCFMFFFMFFHVLHTQTQYELSLY